uniref:Uncharacterized protein n=1 Tax=Triticum urartu TaxID=4572 RepID=A0A8R7R7A4_TRIUA
MAHGPSPIFAPTLIRHPRRRTPHPRSSPPRPQSPSHATTHPHRRRRTGIPHQRRRPIPIQAAAATTLRTHLPPTAPCFAPHTAAPHLLSTCSILRITSYPFALPTNQWEDVPI